MPTLPDLIRSNVGKPIAEGITTRDGRSVRIFIDDAGGDYPIVGAIKSEAWTPVSWTVNGHVGYPDVPSGLDLIAVPTAPVESWLNVYGDGVHVTHVTSRQDADDKASPNRLTCLRLLDGKLAPEHVGPESGHTRFYFDLPNGREPVVLLPTSPYWSAVSTPDGIAPHYASLISPTRWPSE